MGEVQRKPWLLAHKEEILLLVGIIGIIGQGVALIGWDRQTDAVWLGACLALIGIPIAMAADRRQIEESSA